MLKYLTDSFHKGNSYGTLNTYRSAVSLTSPDNIGQDSLISRFLKGVFRLKPNKAKRWCYTGCLNCVKLFKNIFVQVIWMKKKPSSGSQTGVNIFLLS